MKNSLLLAAVVACTLSASVVSAQEKYPPTPPAMKDKAMNMDMMQMMMEQMMQRDQVMEPMPAK